jgi:hypothetical protein
MSFPNEDLKVALSLTQTAPISNGITAEYVPPGFDSYSAQSPSAPNEINDLTC